MARRMMDENNFEHLENAFCTKPPVCRPAASESTDAIKILEEAIDCLKKRGEKYNKDNNKAGRERHMQEITALFNQLTGHNLKPRDGWLFMVCLKMVRAYANGGHDCFVDGAAYFALAGELEK